MSKVLTKTRKIIKDVPYWKEDRDDIVNLLQREYDNGYEFLFKDKDYLYFVKEEYIQ